MRLGIAVTISVRPTASVDSVTRQTKMPAARSVSAEPAVETSWASHSRVKSRFRKTANIDGAGATAAVIVPPGRTGFGGGGASRSLTVRAPNRYALAKQQKPLPVEPVLDRAPAIAAVAAEGPIGRDD